MRPGSWRAFVVSRLPPLPELLLMLSRSIVEVEVWDSILVRGACIPDSGSSEFDGSSLVLAAQLIHLREFHFGTVERDAKPFNIT